MEHYRPDGSGGWHLSQGYFCHTCGDVTSMYGHHNCEQNPGLVAQLIELNVIGGPPQTIDPVKEGDNMEFKARLAGADWYDLKLTTEDPEQATDDGWMAQAAEAFLMGAHEQLELDDGDLLDVQVMNAAGKINAYQVSFAMIPDAQVQAAIGGSIGSGTK